MPEAPLENAGLGSLQRCSTAACTKKSLLPLRLVVKLQLVGVSLQRITDSVGCMCVVVCSAVKISGVRRPCAKLQVKNHVVRECFELSNYVDHNKWCSSRTWEQSRDVSRFRFLDGVR